MRLPDDIEMLLMDDKSNPPLADYIQMNCPNLKIIRCEFTGNWTQGLARNYGADLATGEYLLMTDIDHIISKDVLLWAREFTKEKAVFLRQFGVLSINGDINQDLKTLQRYGLDMRRCKRKGLYGGVHGNSWLMKRSVFMELGKYSVRRASMGLHIMGEDREFNRRWIRACTLGRYSPQVLCPHSLYFYPTGRFHVSGDENPFGLFHTMHRDTWGENKKDENS